MLLQSHRVTEASLFVALDRVDSASTALDDQTTLFVLRILSFQLKLKHTLIPLYSKKHLSTPLRW